MLLFSKTVFLILPKLKSLLQIAEALSKQLIVNLTILSRNSNIIITSNFLELNRVEFKHQLPAERGRA
jgi:hypothetical protein